MADENATLTDVATVPPGRADAAADARARGDANAPKSVLLFSRVDFAWLYPLVMDRMRARYGTRFTVVVPHEKWRAHYAAHCGPRDRILCSADVEDEARRAPLDEAEAYATAARNERRLGLVYLRDVVQQARSVSARYLRYAPNSPHSWQAPPPWPELVKEVNHYVATFESLIEADRIDLVIERAGDLISTVSLHVAIARGIPTTFAVPSRYRSYAMWSFGPYLSGALLARRYDGIGEVAAVAPESLRAPDDSRGNFARAAALRSPANLAKAVLAATRDHAQWTIGDILRRRRAQRLRYRDILRYFFARWRIARWLDRIVERDLARIAARPFVLFLLQFEPEYTTLSLARRFNDTAAVIRQLALALPADVALVVKENVNSIGNRRLGFYQDLCRLPNVTLADHRIPGVELIARTRAVATVSSTGAVEANLLGKPAVIFAQDVEFAFLPHVIQLSDLSTLPAVLAEAVRERSEAEAETIRREGARYRRALAELSFDAAGTRPFRGTATTIPDDQLDRAVDLLVETAAAQTEPAR